MIVYNFDEKELPEIVWKLSNEVTELKKKVEILENEVDELRRKDDE